MIGMAPSGVGHPFLIAGRSLVAGLCVDLGPKGQILPESFQPLLTIPFDITSVWKECLYLESTEVLHGGVLWYEMHMDPQKLPLVCWFDNMVFYLGVKLFRS